MLSSRKSAVALGGAAVIIALTGCAGAAESATNAVEVHQLRAIPQPAAEGGAAEAQGQRLTQYAEALAATGSGAADMQGQRLTQYAEALADTGAGAADMQGQRLALYASARAAAAEGQ